MRHAAAVGVIVGNGGILQDFVQYASNWRCRISIFSLIWFSSCLFGTVVTQSRRERWGTALDRFFLLVSCSCTRLSVSVVLEFRLSKFKSFDFRSSRLSVIEVYKADYINTSITDLSINPILSFPKPFPSHAYQS